MKKSNIVLIGMPGCGKSTLGVVLAKALGKSFCDTDLMIQQAEGKKLYRIIDEKGLDYFAALENRIAASVREENAVIATGGSVIFCRDAMAHLSKIATIVYLKLPLDMVRRRIKNFATRGIAMKPGETLDDIYALRTPLYEKYAEITIDCAGDTFEQNLEKLIDIFK